MVGFSGYKGNFTTEVLVGPGMYERKIEHGVTVVATGAEEYQPKEFLYGEHDRVMTQLELGDFLHDKAPTDAAKWNRVVMIQCVGSRNEENPNCSRICCQGAVKYALQLKGAQPRHGRGDPLPGYAHLRVPGGLLPGGPGPGGALRPLRAGAAARGHERQRQP